MYQAAIVPEHIVRTQGGTFGTSPTGSGPFKLTAWESDKMIRLERFPAYYGGGAYLDGVEYHVYPGAQRSRILDDFEQGLLDEMPVFGQARASLSKKQKSSLGASPQPEPFILRNKYEPSGPSR